MDGKRTIIAKVETTWPDFTGPEGNKTIELLVGYIDGKPAELLVNGAQIAWLTLDELKELSDGLRRYLHVTEVD